MWQRIGQYIITEYESSGLCHDDHKDQSQNMLLTDDDTSRSGLSCGRLKVILPREPVSDGVLESKIQSSTI